MKVRSGTNTIWTRLLFASILSVSSAGATLAMGASVLEPGSQDSLAGRLRTGAVVVFRSFRPLARRFGVELDLAAGIEPTLGFPDSLQTAAGVTGPRRPCEHPSGECVPSAP